MATVDQLIIEIKAETAALRRSLNNVNQQLDRAGTNAERSSGRIKAAFSRAGIGVAALGASLAVVTRGIAQTGMQFEDLRTSLNVVFGGIEQGSEAFEKIINFAQTTPFQIEDVTRAFIALKGSGIEPNVSMLQTFADVSSTSVDSLGAFNAMVRLVQRSAGGGLGLEEINQLDERGIPATKILTEALGKTRLELSTFGSTAEGSALMVETLIDGLAQLFPDAMTQKMGNLSVQVSNLEIAFKGLKDEIFTLGVDDALKNITEGTTSLIQRLTQFLQLAKEGRGQTFRFLYGLPPESDTSGLDKATRIGDGDSTANVVKASTEQVEFLGEFEKLLKQSVPEAEQLQEKIDLINDALRSGAVDAENNPIFDAEEAEKVKGVLQDMIDELDDVATFSDEMKMAITEASATFSKEFTDALLNGESALESFNNFARNIVSQILATFVQLAVVNNILNSIFGAGTFTSLDLGTGKIVPANAGGGKVQRGPTLVGERGPEIFMPDSTGTIMNNMNTKNALSGTPVVVNQSVNFSTGVVPTVRAEVTKMLPQISDVTKGAVLEAAVRGGSYRKGLMGRG